MRFVKKRLNNYVTIQEPFPWSEKLKRLPSLTALLEQCN